jgi:hypothetical protein
MLFYLNKKAELISHIVITGDGYIPIDHQCGFSYLNKKAEIKKS